MWLPGDTEVSVEHKKMAQFEYKGSKLESDIDVFISGQLKHLWRNPLPATTRFHNLNLILFHSFAKPLGHRSIHYSHFEITGDPCNLIFFH